MQLTIASSFPLPASYFLGICVPSIKTELKEIGHQKLVDILHQEGHLGAALTSRQVGGPVTPFSSIPLACLQRGA